MYFYINRIGKGKEKRECHSSAGAASSRPADVNFACSRHSLSSCLHAKGSRYNKGPKCHPSSARGCIAVQKSPMPCITRIGAVSRCWYLFLILLSFADVSRDILRFVLRRSSSEQSPVYSLLKWIFGSVLTFSLSIICLFPSIATVQDCPRKRPFRWPSGITIRNPRTGWSSATNQKLTQPFIVWAHKQKRIAVFVRSILFLLCCSSSLQSSCHPRAYSLSSSIGNQTTSSPSVLLLTRFF